MWRGLGRGGILLFRGLRDGSRVCIGMEKVAGENGWKELGQGGLVVVYCNEAQDL